MKGTNHKLTKKQLEKQLKKQKMALAKKHLTAAKSQKEKKPTHDPIHSGLQVNTGSWLEWLPEKHREFLKEKDFSSAIISLAYRGDCERNTPPTQMFNTLKKSSCQELICSGYYTCGDRNPGIILEVTYGGKPNYLVLYLPYNIRPIVLKRHISQKKYGEKILLENKIRIPCVPYIYDGSYSY